MQIRRIPTKNGQYKYVTLKGEPVTRPEVLEFIQGLVIPPAYRDVTIFYEKPHKILFEGYDAKGRKQQIYSAQWNARQTRLKFRRLIEFGKQLPRIQQDILRFSREPALTQRKVIALLLRVVAVCFFRVGHLRYEKLYGSHGISTIQARHFHFENDQRLSIQFTGKKAQVNHCVVNQPELVRLLRALVERKRPTDFVFCFLDPATGRPSLVSPELVNDFLRGYHPDFTSKMFRTFDANTMFLDFVRHQGDPAAVSHAQRKKQVVQAMKAVSAAVNNTPTVCRKSYISEPLLQMYTEHPVKFRRFFAGDRSARDLFIAFLEKTYGSSKED